MYKYLILFVLSMPLTGIWLVEQGEFAMSIGVPGKANGATEAFAAFAGLLLFVAFLSSRTYRFRGAYKCKPPQTTSKSVNANRDFIRFSSRLLVLNGIFLLAMLFVFGGVQVWLGTVEKGAFRTNLGPLGALPFLMTKFVVPALFAYSTLLLIQTDQGSRSKMVWRVNAALVFLAGSTWGFKTTGLFMLLPGLLILNWKLSVQKLILFGGAFFVSLMVFFFWFDSQLMEDVNVFAFLGTRLTVLQGDVAWHIWGLYREGEPLPNYWPTLLAALGDTVLRTVISDSDSLGWLRYHYDWMLTYLSGSSLNAIANGHSVTGTPFAEGVIAGGYFGVGLFAVIAGLLVGYTYKSINIAILTGDNTTAALLSTYFCFHIFSWLNSGAITQLFHISVVVYLVATYGLIKIMAAQYRSAIALPLNL